MIKSANLGSFLVPSFPLDGVAQAIGRIVSVSSKYVTCIMDNTFEYRMVKQSMLADFLSDGSFRLMTADELGDKAF